MKNKSVYSKFLFVFACIIMVQSVGAQDVPVAGQRFRIANASGLYLTCDPAYNSGYNPWFLDSLYSVRSSVSVDYELNGEAIVSVVNSNPEQQEFTLINPDPNDPEKWAIEAINGEYLSQSTEYAWDCVLSSSIDAAESQLYFIDQGDGIYLFQISTRSDVYVAADGYAEGESVGEYEDGWQYLYRSFIFNDKPIDQDGQTAYWWFEKVNTTTGVDDVTVNNNFSVFLSADGRLLTINAQKGTRASVYTITGQKVIDTELNGALDVSGLFPGVYVVTVLGSGTAKFIKK